MGSKFFGLLFLLGFCLGTISGNAQGKRKPAQEPAPTLLEVPDKKSLSTFDVQQYLIELRKGTDSLIFKDKVDLTKRLSPVNEDTLSLTWSPTNQLVEIAEQVLINSIWVTAFEYYASWDSKKINIYDFDPNDFKDTVHIKLYDPFFGSNWNAPLKETKINSEFGFRRYRWHHGTDLKLTTGDPVFNVFDGIVRMKSYDRNGYGYYVLVRHRNGLETLYGHLSKISVEVGQEVRAGELLGLGGSTGRSTGPHLHFEIRYQGLSINLLRFLILTMADSRGMCTRLPPQVLTMSSKRERRLPSGKKRPEFRSNRPPIRGIHQPDYQAKRYIDPLYPQNRAKAEDKINRTKTHFQPDGW